MAEIASISLAAPPARVAEALGRGFSETGFAVIRDHGIPQDLIDAAGALAKALFALPDAAKGAYHVPDGGGARGYTPFGRETARDASVYDLKEFWHIGRTLPQGHELAGYMPANIWPQELPEFRPVCEALFGAFERAGERALQAIALHLGQPLDFFASAIRDGNSVMRLLHYPPLDDTGGDGAVRAAPHGDINAITLLLGAEEAGLELLTRQGQWQAVPVPEGAMVINIGDMLDRLTNGHLPSTLHRVVNPAGDAARRSRYSMPFFLHFRPDFIIEPLASCIDPSRPGDAPPPISTHDFLQQRLREIGLA